MSDQERRQPEQQRRPARETQRETRSSRNDAALEPNSWAPGIDAGASSEAYPYLLAAAAELGESLWDGASEGWTAGTETEHGGDGYAAAEGESSDGWFEGFGLWGSTSQASESSLEIYEGPGGERPGRPDALERQSSEVEGGYDLLAGSAGGSFEASSELRERDGSGHERSGAGEASVQLGEGITASASFTATDEQTDALGNTSGETVEAGIESGLVVKEGELGVKGGMSLYASDAGRDSAVGGGVSGSVTNKGAEGVVLLGQKAGEEGGTSGHVSLAGGFESDITGEGQDRRYQESVSVGMGGELANETGDKAWGWLSETAESAWEGLGAAVGVGASAEGSAEIAYSRDLTPEDEALLDTIGEDAFRALELARGGDKDLTAVLGNAEAAAALAEGESMSIETELGVEGEVGVGAGTAGLSVSQGKTWKRTFTVDKIREDGVELVELSVRFEEVDTSGWGAALQWVGVRQSFESSQSQGESEGISEKVSPDDPQYNAVYAMFEGAGSIEDVARIEAEVGGLRSWGETREQGEEFAAGPVSVGKNSEMAMEVEVDEDGDLLASGSAENSTAVALFGTTRAREKNLAQFDAEDGGVVLRTTARREESSSGAGGEAWPRPIALSPWAAVESGPMEALAGACQETEARLREVDFDSQDVRLLTARASLPGPWGWCAAGFPAELGAWEQLRRQLVSPAMRAEYAAINAGQAALVARGRALLQFVAVAPHSDAILDKLRNEWGVEPDGEFDTRDADGRNGIGADVDFGLLPEPNREAAADLWNRTSLRFSRVVEATQCPGRKHDLDDDALAELDSFCEDVGELTMLFSALDETSNPVAAADMFTRLGEWQLVALDIEYGETAEPRLRTSLLALQLLTLSDVFASTIAAFDGVDPQKDGSWLGYLGEDWLGPYGAMLDVEVRWWRAQNALVEAYVAAGIAEADWEVTPGEGEGRDLDPDWERVHEIKSWFAGSTP